MFWSQTNRRFVLGMLGSAALAIASGVQARDQAKKGDTAFTIAVIPDTQNYLDFTHQAKDGFPFDAAKMFMDQMRYVADNVEAKGGDIAFVTALGDIWQHQSKPIDPEHEKRGFRRVPNPLHERHMHSIDVPAPQPGADAGEARWLAGDHHTHSRFSTGYDEKADPPTPTVGGDAIYPIPMNALMARKFGLDWMVATDHGGPNHSKVNHDHAYPELLRSRQLVPELVQFFGMEFDTPGADHSSIIVPAGDDEADRLRELEKGYGAREAWPRDPSRNSEGRMLDALRTMDAQQPKPVLFAHHPSRSATGMGKYGLTTPSKLRGWNDTAPEVAIGMEGAPGHQAAGQVGESVGPSRYAAYFGDAIPRGAYGDFPTMGGFDQMTARLGGFWDSMLGEGRRWWITANSDSHINWTEGGFDFWPGEYSKTYVHAPKNPASIIAAMRAGRIFVTTGDLVSELEILLGTGADARPIEFGSTINAGNGEPLHLTIRFRDPDGLNANGDNPAVHHIDLIRGSVGTKSADPNLDRNPSTRVVARFTEAEWKREGEWRVIETALEPVAGDEYLRLRGTNTEDAEPAPDAEGEDAWTDLWFYSNPVFLGSSMRRNP